MINYHEKCVGIVLFKFRQLFIQLWLCPANYEIKPHSHPEEDIKLVYLLGKTTFFRLVGDDLQSFSPRWFHAGRAFNVHAGILHSFTVSNWPLVFINISRFKKGCKAKSAALDFKPI